jgi:hypothetical protein
LNCHKQNQNLVCYHYIKSTVLLIKLNQKHTFPIQDA